LGSQSFIKLAN